MTTLRTLRLALRGVAVTLFAALTAAASAAELRVLSAGAVEPGLRPALAAFEHSSGHHVTLTFATAPQIRERIEGGGAFDVVIAPTAILDALAQSGKLAADPAARVPLGRVGLGVAVRPGAPRPEIASPAAFQQSLLDADSVVFNRASTGLYFETLLKRMNLEAQILPKSTRYADGASVMLHVLNGHGNEIGIGAITEILLLHDRGLQLVGPLPVELQNETTYVAAALPAPGDAGAAAALLRHLGSAATQAGLRDAGIDAAR